MEDKTNRVPPRSGGLGKRIKKLASLLFSLFVIGGFALLVFLIYLRTQALPVTTVLQTSQIVDIEGKLIDSYYTGQNRQLVTLDQIAPTLVNATLAIEDKRFFDHFGVDLRGIARAVLTDIQHMSKVEGASTITQQLARNLYLSQERTWTRKLKEAMYSIQLEMQYSKKEILQKYLNQIYYGHAAYGVQAASKVYYAKDAKDLTLAESALLAGVVKGPKYYSPYMDMENAKKRQKIVLQTMVQQQMITQQEADEAYEQKLEFVPLVGNKPSEAPYFRDYVRYLAIEKLGISEQLYNEGGIIITTTLDLRAQKIAEEVVAEHMKKEKELQAALVAIDPRTGYVKAMVGGKDYAENQFNRVFATTRQPGSSFKPVVYLTALQRSDFSAVTRYTSEPTVFTYDEGRETYMPSNFANQYPNEDIDLRQAISKSDNIYAVHTIMDVGAENVIRMARLMGIESPMKPLPSLALGTFPVSPFEMASAFGVIANQGIRVEPAAILRIEDSAGKILYEAKPKQQRVVDPAYTYVLTKLMESVFDSGGTAHRVADLIKRPVAGKTGTTNTDAWMIGFTPELSTAVWVGYDRDRNISSVESYKAAPIFAEFTERTLEPIPPKIFPIPSGVVNVYIDPTTGKLATDQCPDSRLESFVKGSEPLEYCTVHGAPPAEDTGSSADKKDPTWWEDLKRWWNE